MSFPISWIILAVMLFADDSQHARLSESSNSNPLPKDEVMANANPLTSHILDTTIGRPAASVRTILFKFEPNSGQWIQVNEQLTNQDGRVGNLIKPEEFTPGIYKMFFDTKPYFQAMGTKTFYPFVEIAFEIENPGEHYHVPLLLNPFGYTTYRGS